MNIDEALPRLPTAINVKRLMWLRVIAIPGPAVCLLLVSQFYDLNVPFMPLALIICALVGVNVWTRHRLRSSKPFSSNEFFLQMLIDVAALTGILFFSGGASNPFAFFFLLPLTITATVLPRRYTWSIAIIAASCYTLLLFVRRPLMPLPAVHGAGAGPAPDESIFDLHITGMWIGFVLIAGLIAHFVAIMGETLRDRDRKLAEAREQALKDDRVLSMATLAAGAAHEISTPLATMSVLVEELNHDLDGAPDPRTARRLQMLQAQIARCKDALSVMSTSSGLLRAETAERAYLLDFLNDTVNQIRSLRPEARISLRLEGPEPGPELVVERRLAQALINIAQNAVDESPQDVEIVGSWDAGTVSIKVLDRGPGIDTDPARADRIGLSSKEGGLGVGLFISQAAVEQLGGRISFGERPDGGTEVSVELPAVGDGL
jgi:two-component system sensor histidine kinase RegB